MSEAAAMAVRSTDVLGALSLAADMAMGLRAGHGVRGTYICMHIADALALPASQRTDLYYAALLMDAGCTAWASQTAAMVLGDDVAARRDLFFLTDRTDPRDLLRWMAGYLAAGERLDIRLRRSIEFVVRGREFMHEGLRNTAETAARLADVWLPQRGVFFIGEAYLEPLDAHCHWTVGAGAVEREALQSPVCAASIS